MFEYNIKDENNIPSKKEALSKALKRLEPIRNELFRLDMFIEWKLVIDALNIAQDYENKDEGT
jgi:hypothetical protein